ncbi:ankyrin repeat-containing domain protein [Mycena galericulata]|nr:ankyrin repeat-containing domain protein [Mycena galericulata]
MAPMALHKLSNEAMLHGGSKDREGTKRIPKGASMDQMDQFRAWLTRIPATQGVTPLFVAAQNGHFNIVQFLVTKGAVVNTLGTQGATPLFVAAQDGHTAIVQFPVTKGAEIIPAMQGVIPPVRCQRAVANGRANTVQFLVTEGAIVNTLIRRVTPGNPAIPRVDLDDRLRPTVPAGKPWAGRDRFPQLEVQCKIIQTPGFELGALRKWRIGVQTEKM